MIKRGIGDKTGQFYLIAAIIIVIALIGIASVTNYVITRKGTNLEETERELILEGESVINFGIVDDPDQMEALLLEFAEQYGTYIEDEFEFLFIYGDDDLIKKEDDPDKTGVHVFYPHEIDADFNIIIGGSSTEVLPPVTRFDREWYEVGDDKTITVDLGGVQYDPITLTEGQNFYFIIQQPKQDSGGDDA